MKAAIAVINEVNAASVPHAESLRTYVLTDDERTSANSGGMDIITGVQVCVFILRVVVAMHTTVGGLRLPLAYFACTSFSFTVFDGLIYE